MQLVKRIIVLCFLILLVSAGATAGVERKLDWKKVKVLVYTKNGKGYVHDNIPDAVACFQRLGRQFGFKVDVANEPAVFTESNVRQYNVMVFPSTNNDVFDTNEQRLVFRRYLEAGGGLVGIHSVVGTERNWKWFKMMLGGTFAWHPKFQKYSVRVVEPNHPSTQGLPGLWEKSDECYFMKELWPGTEVLLAHDLTTLSEAEGDKIKSFSAPFAELYPATWYHDFDGGQVWITALGHNKTDYVDPMFVRHLSQGLAFVAGRGRPLDYNMAYASSWDAPLRY